MTRHDLIGQVTVRYLRRLVAGLDESDDRGRPAQGGAGPRIRCAIFGMGGEIVDAIASAVAEDNVLRDEFDVEIPSLETPARMRNRKANKNILFSVTNEEMQTTGQSLETLTRIETDTLRGQHDCWVESLDLELMPEERDCLLAVVQAVSSPRVARTIGMLADYLLCTSRYVQTGTPVRLALDKALPELHLPNSAGRFDKVRQVELTDVVRWEGRFLSLEAKFRPYLLLEDKNGDPIDAQVKENLAKMESDTDIEPLTDAEVEIIERFLSADVSHSVWRDEQRRFAELDWTRTQYLFEGLETRTRDRRNLMKQTMDFLKTDFPTAVDSDDEEMLDRYESKFPAAPTKDLQEFFQKHKELTAAENPKLLAKWEKYLYRGQKTYGDLLEGVIGSLEGMQSQIVEARRSNSSESEVLIISVQRAGGESSFWKRKNAALMRYFAQRYNGIGKLFGENVVFDFGRMPDIFLGESSVQGAGSSGSSKFSRQIKFEVKLSIGSEEIRSVFFWELPAESIVAGLRQDLMSIGNLGGQYVKVGREVVSTQSVSSKGQVQRVDLADRYTILDAAGGSDGLLAGGPRVMDIWESVDENVTKYVNSGLLDSVSVQRLTFALVQFRESYTSAIRTWIDPRGDGVTSLMFQQQAEDYGKLLRIASEIAKSDTVREGVLLPLLSIGVVVVTGDKAAAIVTPWHPLRMAELSAKAMRFRDTVLNVIQGTSLPGANYFEWRRREMNSEFYPEVCIGEDADRGSILLVLEAGLGGYSLAESPEAIWDGKEESSSISDTQVAAKCFADVSRQYLQLLPHEKFNFSAVLYDAQAKSLPRVISNRLAEHIVQENDLQCDLMLVHSDQARMREVYEQQNAAELDSEGSAMSSEAALNFLSRLRIGFADSELLAKNPADIVLLQDVFARKGAVKWKECISMPNVMLSNHLPPHQSRRRPMGIGDKSSSTYLVCPTQPRAQQSYINAIHHVLDRDYDGKIDMLPVREIDIQSSEVGDEIDRVHELGRWVISCDNVLDRHILARMNIDIVRHIHLRESNRHVVVSTKQDREVLEWLLRRQLGQIDPELNDERRSRLSEILIEHATELSGLVVMRAARHSRNASELIGLVLGMRKIAQELSAPEIGWFFLDDYATWFGQDESYIADIMAVAPCFGEDGCTLNVIISETKYVSELGHRDQQRKSATQLEDTVRRLAGAFGAEGNSFSRQDWCHLVANMMIENMVPFRDGKIGDMNLFEWAEQVREGAVRLNLLGISYVFVHDGERGAIASGVVRVPNPSLSQCIQIVYDRADTKGIIYSLDEPTLDTQVQDETGSNWENASVLYSPREVPCKEDGQEVMTKEVPTVTSDGGEESERNNTEGRRKPKERIEKPTNTPPKVENDEEPENALHWPSTELSEWIEERPMDGEEGEDGQEWLDEVQVRLMSALRGYDLIAEVTEARLTPNSARLCFRGSDRMTVRKVERVQQELLTSHAIDVIGVLPAPQAVIVIVRRPKRETLLLKDVWTARILPDDTMSFNASPMFGVSEESGQALYINVDDAFAGLAAHGPHTLIAGETGSGKGVLVRTLILDICATNSPTEANILMIDPKAGMDFPWLRDMPHLVGELITHQNDAIDALKGMVDEMEKRNRILADAATSKLSLYNQQVNEADRLPRIWVFHEEFADWMLIGDYKEAVAECISRLGVKSRAVGIHLVMITQRPDRDVMPMQLRANLTNRLCLKVADQRNSKLILDVAGAERLLGQGHLLAKLSGEGDIIHAQVPYSTDGDGYRLQQLITRMWIERGLC